MIYAASFAVFVALCFVQLGVCQKSTPIPTPPAKNKDSGHGCERVTFPCTGGVPGIPGANGIPGIPGPRGARGDKGDSGSDGKPGAKGDRGLRGILGYPCVKGPQENKGDQGARGKYGYPAKGNKGEKGNPGTKGDAGEKGDAAAAAGPISAANWKQCVWENMNDDRDSGKIEECSFNKLQNNTGLKVSFQGVVRVQGDIKCNRWYFKFNGRECSGPVTIETIVFNNWSSGNPDLHRPGSFDGYCENLPGSGMVTVELWVGSCKGLTQGDAYTGWNSVSRIMVEEVPMSQ